MTYKLRIPRSLLNRVKEDLRRPHLHAFERVGFLFCRTGNSGALVIAADYEPIPDSDYIDDDTVGAKISGDAIRRAMQRALSTGESVFHVHAHEHSGQPAFSRTDILGLRRLLPSFSNVNARSPHGALLLSEDSLFSAAWSVELNDLVPIDRVAVVGFPFQFWIGNQHAE